MKKFLFENFFLFCDAPEFYQFGPQDPATPTAEGMLVFHNYLMFFVILIGTVVLWMLYYSIKNFDEKVNKVSKNFTHSSLLEIIWTIIPAVLLVLIAVPSFSLLYSLDELIDPSVTLKIVGHQWYWSYEYSDYSGFVSNDSDLNFDSYMIPTIDLEIDTFRLLEVDNQVVLPANTHIRLLITSSDVLHSWSIPSFCIKVDACHGRLSQASLFMKREGVYYGQCSEICGINHGFRPIVVKGLSINSYINWLTDKFGLMYFSGWDLHVQTLFNDFRNEKSL